jgi:succinate dehydrogenase / fumarate reductase flavoprotein subunit
MFDDIPDAYSHQTSDNEEEGWRYIAGDKEARRPPELLTRDHVARCIIREIKEGRGSPHGGVFLNIHWIKEHIKDAEAHIKKKLPSMYHQFKELAGVDITSESMEVGPTTHYVMGGIKVDADTQMSTVPGLFAAGECAGGLHGANRLGGNSLSDLVVFGKRAGQHAAEYASGHDMPTVDEGQVQDIAKETLAPFERGDTGENPFQIQHALQEMMQAKAGIVRTHVEMTEGLEELQKLKARAAECGVQSNRDFNPGWNTALDLKPLLACSEMILMSAINRKESRGGHYHDDYPEKCPEHAKWNTILHKSADGTMTRNEAEIPAVRSDLQEIIEENQR